MVGVDDVIKFFYDGVDVVSVVVIGYEIIVENL